MNHGSFSKRSAVYRGKCAYMNKMKSTVLGVYAKKKNNASCIWGSNGRGLNREWAAAPNVATCYCFLRELRAKKKV